MVNLWIVYLGRFDHDRALISRALAMMVFIGKLSPEKLSPEVSELQPFTQEYDIHSLRCLQTWQAWKSTRFMGVSKLDNKQDSVFSSKPCLITGG